MIYSHLLCLCEFMLYFDQPYVIVLLRTRRTGSARQQPPEMRNAAAQDVAQNRHLLPRQRVSTAAR